MDHHKSSRAPEVVATTGAAETGPAATGAAAREHEPGVSQRDVVYLG